MGKARYLLNIVFNTWWFKSTLFRNIDNGSSGVNKSKIGKEIPNI